MTVPVILDCDLPDGHHTPLIVKVFRMLSPMVSQSMDARSSQRKSISSASTPLESIAAAARQMDKEGVKRLPVVDDLGGSSAW